MVSPSWYPRFQYSDCVDSVIDSSTMREKEATSRTKVIEEEQFLLPSDLAVIPFRSLDQECFVLAQLLFIWERDTVDALQ